MTPHTEYRVLKTASVVVPATKGISRNTSCQDDTSMQRGSCVSNKTTMSQLVKMQNFCLKHISKFQMFSSFLYLKQHLIENAAHFSVKLKGQRLMDKCSSALNIVYCTPSALYDILK